MGMKQGWFRSGHHSSSHLQRGKGLSETVGKLTCGPQIKLDYFMLIPVVFGEEEVERRSLREGTEESEKNRPERKTKIKFGVPAVAQRDQQHLCSIKDTGSTSGLTQWVKGSRVHATVAPN